MKSADVDRMVKDILDQNEQAILKAMVRTGARIERDFLLQAKIYLDAYYDEYAPRVYKKRTGNLKNNTLHRRRGNQQEGTVIEAGIYFSSDDMDKYPRHPKAKAWEANPFATLEDFVLDNAMQGYHGREGIYNGSRIDDEMDMYVQWYERNMLHKILQNNIDKLLK